MGFHITARTAHGQSVEVISNISHSTGAAFGDWLYQMHPGLAYDPNPATSPLIPADTSELAYLLCAGYNGEALSLNATCRTMKGLSQLVECIDAYPGPLDERTTYFADLARTLLLGAEFAVGHAGSLCFD